MTKFERLFVKKLLVKLFIIVFLVAVQSRDACPQQSQPVKPCPHLGSGATEQGTPISGRVVEVLNSNGYTYIYLEKNGGKIWVVIPKMKIVKGKNMSFEPGKEIVDFESKTLMLKFDRIILSIGPIGRKGKRNAIKSTGSEVTSEKIKVGKAPGFNAYTIEELYKKKKILDGSDIMVRGKVVKVSENIMNRNWIHLQDGSGDPKKGNNTLVVTSKDLPSVGDILTANGTLRKDKDFGDGYKYNVIVEDEDIYPF